MQRVSDRLGSSEQQVVKDRAADTAMAGLRKRVPGTGGRTAGQFDDWCGLFERVRRGGNALEPRNALIAVAGMALS